MQNKSAAVGRIMKVVPGAIALIVLLVIAGGGYVVIGPGQRGVLMNWGAVQPGVLKPGLHFKIPFVQSVASLTVRVQNTQSTQSAASKDLQVVTTQVAVNYHLQPDAVDKIYQNVGSLAAVQSRILDPAIANAVKAVTAHFNADELVANRDQVRLDVGRQIRKSVTPYNITVDAVNITNFSFSKQYDHAIEAKQVAQQRALQAQYELQQAQIDSQKQVVEAKAKAQAVIEAAKGQAQATVLGAQADAKAMDLRRKALSPAILQLEAIKQWNGALPSTLFNGSAAAPFIDLSKLAVQGASTR
jgi:regulator of protease activity HflC (stomatin/prohibitin superfamily)